MRELKLPWVSSREPRYIVNSDGICLAIGHDEEIAKHIILCINSHDALVAFVDTVSKLVIIPPYMTEQARQLMMLQDMAQAVLITATGEKQ